MRMELLSHNNASSPDPLHQEKVFKRPIAYSKMESLVKEMQDPEHGVPVRSQKLFLTSIPAAFAGYDIIEWLMERLNIEDSGEAIHLANLLCQHGYFFPVGDNRALSVKDDSSLYRFQTPYYWPSQVPNLDSVDYAIYLAKRTMRNKQKHGLDDYEVDALNNLRKNLAQKWDFITMQADEQVRISKERKKVDKMVTDSQERAFWRVLRPPPGTSCCVETPPMHCPDFHANEGVKQIRRTNLIEDLRAEVDLLRTSCIRTRIKVSQALESLASHCEIYYEHDPCLVPRQPSNPWLSDDICYWVINAPLMEIPTERRVKKWATSMEDLVSDPTGLREFTAYLKKEYCHENIRFWLAVRDLRYGPITQLRTKATHIYNEFLSPGAPCEINIDMRTMEKVQKEMNYMTPSRFTFDPAADHVYTLLLKKDCYPRFIRSENYKSLLANALQPNQKKRFFSFVAPGKKKSSTTTPPIFPVSLQSATAGVGEVVKAADEVILITTGNKPDLLSDSSQDRLSALADCPYRGDLVTDDRKDNDSAKHTLSQASFDDVCPWESMERLPEKEKVVSQSVPVSVIKAVVPANPSIVAAMTAAVVTAAATDSSPKRSKNDNSLTSLLSKSVPAAVTVTATASIPESRMIAQKQKSVSKQTSVASMKHDDQTDSPSQLSAQSSVSVTSLPQALNSSTSANFNPIAPSSVVMKTQNSETSLQETKLPSPSGAGQGTLSLLPTESSEPALTVASTTSASTNEPTPSTVPPTTNSNSSIHSILQETNTGERSVEHLEEVSDILPNDKPGQEKRLDPKNPGSHDICPWDHENGSQAESTVFVKTYATLGYL